MSLILPIHKHMAKEVSNSTRRHADNNGNHADLRPIKFATALSYGSTLFEIPPYY